MAIVALDAHASTTAVALLAAPELAIDELLINLDAGRNAGNYGDQRLSVGLSRSAEAKHKRSILQERPCSYGLIKAEHASLVKSEYNKRPAEAPASH